jgi:polysaccharide pyruvyl transferase WcaK-like protein
VTFGTGVHDLDFSPLNEKDRKRWISVFRNCVELGVRGPLSKATLDKLGVGNARVVGDPAVLYVREAIQIPCAEKVLGINWGTTWGNVFGGDENGPMDNLVKALVALNKRNWKFRFFCVWPEDLLATKKLISAAGLSNASIVEEYFSAERFMGEISLCRVCVAMKLHAAILSVCAGVPTLALEYQPKTRDFMTSIGSESETLRFGTFDDLKLVEAIEGIDANADSVSFRQWNAATELSRVFARYVESLNKRFSAWRGEGVDTGNV